MLMQTRGQSPVRVARWRPSMMTRASVEARWPSVGIRPSMGVRRRPNACQSLSGTQRTQWNFAAGKTIYGNQMKTMDEYQTLRVRQMTSNGDQTLYGGQIKTVSDDIFHWVHIMPQAFSSSSYPRPLYVASSHFIQGQPVEMQKWDPKIQRCPLQKRPDILNPYICTYENCGKAYAKSSYHRIHEYVHTGE